MAKFTYDLAGQFPYPVYIQLVFESQDSSQRLLKLKGD